MRAWLSILMLTIALPVYAQLTPEQKQQAQKTIGEDLRRMGETGQETRRLDAMIQNGTPGQQRDYRKLEKQRDQQQATGSGTGSAANRWGASNVTSEEVPRPHWHPPGNAESVNLSPHTSHAIHRGLEANQNDCSSRSHPERDAACQAVATQSGF